MTACIAICVDDFGMDPGVDEAVLRLSALGRISAASCMVGGPSWAAGAARLRQQAGRLDVGLHLDLTQHPLDAQLKRPLRSWIAAAWTRSIDLKALRREIDAQLDAFEFAWGRPPDHVDGHQHVHQFPGVRESLLQSLQERYGDRLPWVRCTRAPERAGIKARGIHALGGAATQRLALRRGFAMNTRLLGSYGFDQPWEAYAARLASWLEAARDGDLLMCHPAAWPAQDDPIAQARVVEWKVLASGRAGELLARGGLQVCRMGIALAAGRGEVKADGHRAAS